MFTSIALHVAALLATLADVLAAPVASAQATKPAKPAADRWALLIGVDDYAEANDLKFCGADQRALRERLLTSGFDDDHIFLIEDQAKESKYRPSKANIERQLVWC